MKEKDLLKKATEKNMPDMAKIQKKCINQDCKAKTPFFLQRKYILIASCLVAVIITTAVAVPLLNPAENDIDNKTITRPPQTAKSPTFPTGEQFDLENNSKTGDPNEEFINSIADFSYATGSEFLANSEENLNYSPISLYTALSLLSVGAEGNTQDELFNLLDIGDKDIGYLSTEMDDLYRSLYFKSDAYNLLIGNSLWVDNRLHLNDEFSNIATNNFYSSLFPTDFTDPNSGVEMSNWIKDNTGGTLAPEIEVDPQQLLSIINTIYYKNEWQQSMSKERTKAQGFILNDGSEVQTDFMFDSKNGEFYTGDNFTRGSLDLKHGDKMNFILPNEGVSVDDILNDETKLKEAISSGEKSNGMVFFEIPKFAFSSEFDLVDSLKALGVSEVFTDLADFSTMSDQRLSVSSVDHGTYIAIDEYGVEAAAYTNIGMTGNSMPNETFEMTLNRPFIYTITAENGTILFVGVCRNPTK